MSDYRQTTDEIRAFLSTADRARTPELNSLANEYAGLCQEANGRLRRCLDYLRHGRRTEAIHLAESQPLLLDVVTALDFPEIDDWQQVCAAYGLSRSARVMMEAARELNEAYAPEQSLSALLARQRSLALSRAPLSQRLTVLRELLRRDVRNAAWQEDLRTIEQARLREISTEALAAIKGRQIEAIDRLLTELKETTWNCPVPDELKTTLAAASMRNHRDVAAQELWNLAPRVNAACASGSVPEAREVLKKWSAIVKASGFALPADLREVIRPLNEMIDTEEDRHERERQLAAVCERLRQAIRAGEPLEQLKNLHLEAVRLELPIPDALERQYRQAMAEAEAVRRNESRRSYLLAIALAALVALALGGLIVVIVISSAHK